MNNDLIEPPDPEMLAREAEEEIDKRLLESYSKPISILRDKNFSFREIAEWLTKRGIPADRNAVYRAYTKGLDPVQAIEEDEADEQIEIEEAIEDARWRPYLTSPGHAEAQAVQASAQCTPAQEGMGGLPGRQTPPEAQPAQAKAQLAASGLSPTASKSAGKQRRRGQKGSKGK